MDIITKYQYNVEHKLYFITLKVQCKVKSIQRLALRYKVVIIKYAE